MITVLLLEDDPVSIEVLRVVLNDRGYRVLEAVTADEAIELCALHPARIDLIVADVILRHVNGPALTRKLKRIRPRSRIVFISGHAKDEILNRGLLESEELESGQSCFLQKPFTAEQLGRVTESLLAARDASPDAVASDRSQIEHFLLEEVDEARRDYLAAPPEIREVSLRRYHDVLKLFNRFATGDKS